MAYKYRQGRFKCKNPEKYKGNFKNIVYRSSWEFRFMRWADIHPDVIEWSSEELIIPYVSPVDGQRHRYYPDFYIKCKDKEDNIRHIIIEVKPKTQCSPPVTQKRITEQYINKVSAYLINQAKWEAASEWCKKKNIEFRVMTEQDLGIKR